MRIKSQDLLTPLQILNVGTCFKQKSETKNNYYTQTYLNCCKKTIVFRTIMGYQNITSFSSSISYSRNVEYYRIVTYIYNV